MNGKFVIRYQSALQLVILFPVTNINFYLFGIGLFEITHFIGHTGLYI